jgi:S1-C subfamily serine protease
MKIKLIILFALASMFFVGCKNPGVVELSPGVYTLAREDHGGIFGNPSALKAGVIRDANAFAERQGKVAIPISTKAHPVGVLGDWASFEYVFKLVDTNSPEAQGIGGFNVTETVVPPTGTQLRPEGFTETQFRPVSNSRSESSKPHDNPSFSGTGFFITDDGYLISNFHVVKDATKVRLLTNAGLIDAKVVQVDAANDLALLKSGGRFKPLAIAASRTVALGGTVATVGFPDIGLQGFAPKLAKGEIASLSGAGDDPRYFQISVPVQPGNSGGALVDERGNVIGIVSAKLDALTALAASGALPENVNYAIKSSFLLSFLESVPDVSAKLKAPNAADEKFEDVVKSAQDAAVLVLVY